MTIDIKCPKCGEMITVEVDSDFFEQEISNEFGVELGQKEKGGTQNGH